ncbi:MAG: hypothetical protein ABJN24_01045 [Hyphomicrobiales bacterium]
MGAAKQKKLVKSKILQNAERCVYCANKSDLTIEHMPPISIFTDRLRPAGLMFAACKDCNNGSSGADFVANIFSRLSGRNEDEKFWASKEGKKAFAGLDKFAPEVRADTLRNHTAKPKWVLDANTGLYKSMISMELNSPILKNYLDVFAAKIGMTLFCEHVGNPLPLKGGVQTFWFLNEGINQKQVRAILKILPLHGKLKQGTFNSDGQFVYRYNCDGKSIFAALVLIRSDLIILVFAVSDLKFRECFDQLPLFERTANFMQPGHLLEKLISAD